MARAMGCSLAASTAAAHPSTSWSLYSGTASMANTCIMPVVMVPVLSSTTVSTRRVLSSTSGPLMSTPICAPRPVPTNSAVGVAKPNAHGQAMMSTAMAGPIAWLRLPVRPNQKPKVATARATTTGTNTPATRSAKRCTGAFPLCARSTRRAICARVVSAPTRVARTTSRPFTLMVAPVTASPTATSRGTLSPVTNEVSTLDAPSATTPSVAMRSPGRTTNWSPTFNSATGTRRSIPLASTTLASNAPRSSRARSAPPACRFARDSKYRPARMSATVVEATSR